MRALGGAQPEMPPTPEQCIRDLERREQKRIEAERQPRFSINPQTRVRENSARHSDDTPA
jgi:hypothetical protein